MLSSQKADLKNSQTSIVIFLGKRKSTFFIYLLMFTYIITSITSLLLFNHMPRILLHQAILGVIWLILTYIFVQYNYFKHNERYRLLGDFVFIIPIIILI